MPKDTKIKVAIVQFAPLSYQIQENRDKALYLTQEALGSGARIVLLPELFDSGYCVEDRDKEYALTLKDHNSFTLKPLFELAAQYHSYIIACSMEKTQKNIFDTAYIIGPKGFVGKYRKIYLWGNEKHRFARGKKYPIFELEFESFSVRLGLQICYEIGFTEGVRALALQGAEILCCPAAFGEARSYVWNLATRARALENGLFVLAANRSGCETSKLNNEKLYFAGKSKIINPKGEVLQEIVFDEDFSCEEIDLDEVRIQRQNLPYLKDINLNLQQKILRQIDLFNPNNKE
ncbi:carbon-nitrogen hydrolase family protein [Helicobacter aurati]|uniref:Carbon-nitrogen hydrolase family protein n=1 Tax=Helicobacter aurati TaxID=137778 RepID=A0A3D8IXX0_9HELI|nr:carbon-nitrogen hydrolase family protein [Helicobacter aurati]RDU69765.1 carbon-nitrogen hydrolase family protein [Helicobacter aurati]